MNYCSGDIRVRSRKFLLIFCWISIFFDILVASISWTAAQTPLNHAIFWMSVMKTFRCIYENYFNKLLFLPEISTKLLKKCTFLDNSRIITQEANMETQKMTPFFHLLSTLYVCNIHSCIWNSPNLFSCGPTLGPFWSAKYLNFGQKLLIRTAHHTFLESRHPEVFQNLY